METPTIHNDEQGSGEQGIEEQSLEEEGEQAEQSEAASIVASARPRRQSPPHPGSMPVGDGNYEAKQGDCIESIAFSHGLFWETIWNDPHNRNLRNLRKNPNVLLTHDKVFVPELRPKFESCTTDGRHRFIRRGVPSSFHIRLLDARGRPRADLDYTLTVEGHVYSGKTSAEGKIRIPVAPNAKRGRLLITTDGMQEKYELNLGHLDPIDSLSGVQQRLSNMGFDCGGEGAESGGQLRSAILAFQSKYNLSLSGEADEATKQAILDQFGS